MRPDDEPTALEISDRIDEAVLRSLTPRRAMGLFVYNVGSFIAVVGGAVGLADGGWDIFRDWRLYAAGLVVGAAQSLHHHWQQRRQLRRTSGEALADLRGWDALVRPGWPLRVLGLAVGMAALVATFVSVLVAVFAPGGLAGGVLEWLRMTAFGATILVPVFFLLHPIAVRQLRTFDPEALEAARAAKK